MTEDSSDVGHGGRVLKRDALGRVRTDATARESILVEFERSGLSGTKFSALVGIKYATFASWVQRRKRMGGGSGRKRMGKKASISGALCLPALDWVEAKVERRTPVCAGKFALRVLLPGGAILEIADEAQTVLGAGLLRALQSQGGGASC